MQPNHTRLARRRQGLCVDCGKPPEDGLKSCRSCRAVSREKCKRRAKRMAGSGRCACGKPLDGRSGQCQRCYEVKRRLPNSCKELGLCVRCGGNRDEGAKHCEKCKIYMALKGRRLSALLKAEVIDHYGGCCETCGETTLEFLSIDHVGGGGTVHRKNLQEETNQSIFRWLRRNGYPSGYRILCFNHNCTKGGGCASAYCLGCGGERLEGRFCCEECLKIKKWQQADSYRRLKREVILGYGRKCSCCSEDCIGYLTLDHVNGGGRSHRQQLGSGIMVYRWAKKNNYPNVLTVLCFNCNCAKGFSGECPHERERRLRREAESKATGH